MLKSLEKSLMTNQLFFKDACHIAKMFGQLAHIASPTSLYIIKYRLACLRAI